MIGSNLAGKRIAVYARYSGSNQRESSIDDQIRVCDDAAKRDGGKLDPELIFTDYAISEKSMHRPGFERLMQVLEERRIDLVLTEDVSRITRDFADAAHIFNRLRYLSVPLRGVSDGIDTSAKHGKVTYTFKSLMSDLYLDELRDKTLRGLEGRALAGYSTGGLPYGYRSVAVRDALDQVVGHRVEIDDAQADRVRRVFRLYLEGKSLAMIAKLFNAEHVPPPRAKTRHRRKGWVASTIRDFLHNEAYVGRWTFKKRQWVKIPGTNIRRPKPRDPTDVISKEHPDRRIIDEETWLAVQARLADVRACYAGDRKRGAAFATRAAYPFSGILRCGACGAPMTISAGTSARYYNCSDYKKRGTCSNRFAVREDTARALLLAELRHRLTSPDAVAQLRKLIAEELGRMSRLASAELTERQERLSRTEARIGGLVRFIAEGDHSEYVRTTLKDLEAQARTEKSAIATLRAASAGPIKLPRQEDVVARAFEVERLVREDPAAAREALKRYFADGEIKLMPQPDGTYIAESKLLPLIMLAETTKADPGGIGPRGPAKGCAGRI